MVPIHTHPPSRAYDEGWDRIFKKTSEASEDDLSSQSSANPDLGGGSNRPERRDESTSPEALPTPEREKQRAALAELTRLTEEMGGYSTDREKTEISSDDAKQTET